MFKTEAIRLLRNTWKSATMLAQELYAILCNDDLPLEHAGPITLKKGGEWPAFEITGRDSGDTLFRFDFGNDVWDFGLDANGNLVPISKNGEDVTPTLVGFDLSGSGGSAGKGNIEVFPATVTEMISPTTYRVKPNEGAIASFDEYEVTIVPTLAEDEELEVGTEGLVQAVLTAEGTSLQAAYMQVPTWLA